MSPARGKKRKKFRLFTGQLSRGYDRYRLSDCNGFRTLRQKTPNGGSLPVLLLGVCFCGY